MATVHTAGSGGERFAPLKSSSMSSVRPEAERSGSGGRRALASERHAAAIRNFAKIIFLKFSIKNSPRFDASIVDS